MKDGVVECSCNPFGKTRHTSSRSFFMPLLHKSIEFASHYICATYSFKIQGMYIPKLNSMTDMAEVVAFMQQFSFATIITAKDGLPIATHLPFLVTTVQENIVLTSHFAKANEHWKDIVDHKVLVIFSEPHAYISPAHYDKELNVPTWNYISVHAYGSGRLITETEAVMSILERTIDNYEAGYHQQWDRLPADYKLKLANGIVAFEITVTALQGKKKLSQNRSESEKERIITALSKSDDTHEQLIAMYMKSLQQIEKGR